MQWKIVGKATLQDTAEKFANDASPVPPANKETQLNVPEKENSAPGAANL